MTIAERINLHRCGYSRAEIDALAKEEKDARAAEEQTPAPDPAKDQTPAPDPAKDQAPAPDPAKDQEPDPVLEAIKGLTAAIQASNINKTPQPEAQPETVSDLLKNL